ncbi:MAG: FtsW/RodA/SpoVE family cell cycle protein, partial [Exilispira sp.]
MKNKIDIYILLAFISLLIIGTINIFSQTQIPYKDYPLKKLIFIKHLFIIFVSIFLGMIFFFLNIEYLIKKLIIPISILMFILLLIPIIFKKFTEINGSYRWITFKYFSIQPSEFSKLYLVLFFSYWFSKKKDSRYSFKNDLLFPLIVATIILLMIFIQKDLSTSFLIGIFLIITFVITGVPILTIVYFLILTVCIFIILIFSEPYRINRILAFLTPQTHSTSISFQNYQALRFIGLGKLYGKGLGWAMSNGEYLPLSYSDFAFPGIVCEMGLLGGFFVIFCY